MATLYIEEHTDLAFGPDGQTLQSVVGMPAVTQKVAVGGTSAQSAALAASTRFVVLTADVGAQWAIGANPTADGDSAFLPAGVPRGFRAAGGEKIAVIEQQ